MSYLNFEIKGICAGWFDVVFLSGNKQVELSASDAWGNDSPRALLHILLELLEERMSSAYVIFDEEPGTYFICIQKNENKTMNCSILYSEEDNNELLLKDNYGSLTNQEIRDRVKIEDELIYVEDISLLTFVRTVVRSFEEYSKSEKLKSYEENWMDFPVEEFNHLKRRVEK